MWRNIGHGTARIAPHDASEVVHALRACAEQGLRAIVASVPPDVRVDEGSVVLDLSALDHVTIDPALRRVRAEVGCDFDELRRRVEADGLALDAGPAFAFGGTLGDALASGWFASRSDDGTPHTALEVLDVVTADGEQLALGTTGEDEYRRIVREGGRPAQLYEQLHGLADRYGAVIRDRDAGPSWFVAGYDLDALLPERGFQLAHSLLGSGNRFAIPLAAQCVLVERPPFHRYAAFGFRDAATAARSAPFADSYDPVTLFGFDEASARFHEPAPRPGSLADRLPPGGAWLLAEFAAPEQRLADAAAESLCESFRRRFDPVSVALLGESVPSWPLGSAGGGGFAVACPLEELGGFLAAFADLAGDEQRGVRGDFGRGYVCLGVVSPDDALTRATAQLAAEHGGALAGADRSPLDRAERVRTMFGREIARAFEELHAIWDPEGRIVAGPLGGPGTRCGAAPVR